MQQLCSQQAANPLGCDLKPVRFTLRCIRTVSVWPRALQIHTSQSIRRLNRFECRVNVRFLCVRVGFWAPRGGATPHKPGRVQPPCTCAYGARVSKLACCVTRECPRVRGVAEHGGTHDESHGSAVTPASPAASYRARRARRPRRGAEQQMIQHPQQRMQVAETDGGWRWAKNRLPNPQVFVKYS